MIRSAKSVFRICSIFWPDFFPTSTLGKGYIHIHVVLTYLFGIPSVRLSVIRFRLGVTHVSAYICVDGQRNDLQLSQLSLRDVFLIEHAELVIVFFRYVLFLKWLNLKRIYVLHKQDVDSDNNNINSLRNKVIVWSSYFFTMPWNNECLKFFSGPAHH